MSTSSFAIAQNFHLPRVFFGLSGGGAEEGGVVVLGSATVWQVAVRLLRHEAKLPAPSRVAPPMNASEPTPLVRTAQLERTFQAIVLKT